MHTDALTEEVGTLRATSMFSTIASGPPSFVRRLSRLCHTASFSTGQLHKKPTNAFLRIPQSVQAYPAQYSYFPRMFSSSILVCKSKTPYSKKDASGTTIDVHTCGPCTAAGSLEDPEKPVLLRGDQTLPDGTEPMHASAELSALPFPGSQKGNGVHANLSTRVSSMLDTFATTVIGLGIGECSIIFLCRTSDALSLSSSFLLQ